MTAIPGAESYAESPRISASGGLEIVHLSARCLVVNKPAGLLSVRGKGPDGHDCVVERVRAFLPWATGSIAPHRLDMDTSGLMVCGLDPEAHRDLCGQFERREVGKAYLALVEGVVLEDSGLVDLPIRPDIENRPYQIVDHEHGRPALTEWSVRRRWHDRTELLLRPITGRTHQLRVHAAIPRREGGIGHPILGDVLYGRADSAPRLMLHCCRLSFVSLETGRRETFESAPPW